jgi:hypothetical protein
MILFRLACSITCVSALISCNSPETEASEPESSTANLQLPADYQGRWASGPEFCDRDQMATGEWFYVGENVVGSFEHMYPLSDLVLADGAIEFETERGGPTGTLELIGAEKIRFSSAGSDPVELVLCSKDPKG